MSYRGNDKPRMPPPPVGRKPKIPKGDPPDPSLISKFKRPDSVKLKFGSNEIGANPSDLAVLLCSNTLPQLVQVIHDFRVEGNSVSLKNGDILMLHMIVERNVVHAVDDSGNNLYLPIQAEQVYERLTIDPRVDDRLYIGVEGLLKADILPPMVRVIENYYSPDPSECVDDEDILELYRVDVAPEEKRHRGRMCVYGKNQQGYTLHLHQGMTTAHFTTKLSATLHPMTELIEHAFPQRVRIPSDDPRRPNIKAEKILTLVGVEKKFDVIMTRSKQTENIQVFGIPSETPLKLKLTSGSFQDVAKSLPPIYSIVNTTWLIHEVGHRTLGPTFQQIPQPKMEILEPWMRSFEGKNAVKEAAKVNDEDTKRQITELKNEVERLTNLYNKVKSITPEPPIREDLPPPPRPPKPDQKPPTPPPINASPKLSSSKAKANYVLSFMKRSTSKKGLRSPTSPVLTSPKQQLKSHISEDEYEMPINDINDYDKLTGGQESEDSDDESYDMIPESVIKAKDKDQLEKLKRVVEEQKKTLTIFRQKETSLKKELYEAKNKNDEHVQRIYALQKEVDALLQGEEFYESIDRRPLPSPPNNNQNPYSTPSSGVLPGMKISTEQLQSYTVAGVEKFMKEIKMEKYATVFRVEEIDGPMLLALEEAMLINDLGMTTFDARRLCVKIGKAPGQ